MAIPRIFTIRSIALPASFIQNITSTIMQLITAPHWGSIPVSTSSPKPQPAILPILNASPPKATRAANRYPSPGNNLLERSCAWFSLTVIILQIFNWAPISITTEIRIINPKLVSSCCVKMLVLFKNPGPMADVAIKNAAPSIAEFFFIPASP